jgi:hypothetical protein
MDGRMMTHDMELKAEIPHPVKGLLDDLRLLQAQIDALPGPRLHQDHDFVGDRQAMEKLHDWLGETAWVPYWGASDVDREPRMLFLGGRDPWIETLELKLWGLLEKLASEAGCKLCGRGAVSPEDDELELIHILYPELAAANGWVFSRQGNVVQ